MLPMWKKVRTTSVGSARHVAYRLRAWPDLAPRHRTAAILRTLSRMTIGPVTHRWFLERVQLPEPEADALIVFLVDIEALEVIDLATSGTEPPGMLGPAWNACANEDREVRAAWG